MIHYPKIFLLILFLPISSDNEDSNIRDNYKEKKKYIYFTYTYIIYAIYSSNVENIN